MTSAIKSDRIILPTGIINGYVYFSDGKITAVTTEEMSCDILYDMTGDFVSPGFIDMHTHGGMGYDFIGDSDGIVKGCNFHLQHGTTSICPTVSAAPFGVMKKAVGEIGKAMKSPELKANIIGAHLEGPYLSKAQCGAQSTDFITPPVEEEYTQIIKEYPKAVARWSYAPENDEDNKFLKFLRKNGIVASAGHTNAEYGDIKKALNEGMSLITHLYSCTSTITRKNGFRHLGVIESAMLEDELYAEIIADGRHLPPELIKLIIKIKGTDKIALITDSLHIAGTDIKHGFMVDTEFIIEDGVCKLMDRSAFAGSIATADVLVRTVVNEAGVDICDAVKMITKVPAEIMGLNKGTLAVGKDADIIVFDDDINVKKVFVNGLERL